MNSVGLMMMVMLVNCGTRICLCCNSMLISLSKTKKEEKKKKKKKNNNKKKKKSLVHSLRKSTSNDALSE